MRATRIARNTGLVLTSRIEFACSIRVARGVSRIISVVRLYTILVVSFLKAKTSIRVKEVKHKVIIFLHRRLAFTIKHRRIPS